ncbi:MAG: response regulator [Candidatus Brocadia sp.]|nr:response regulator [Candidatus Brocadia sp.]
MDTSILLATDSLEKYGDMAGYLRKNGFQNIFVATKGDEALRRLNEHVPDFAILDINLPVLDGLQLCKIMKSDAFKQCENIPVILLAGTYKSPMASQLARSVGVYRILTAPFAMEDLLLLIYNKLYPEMIAGDKIKSLHCKAKVMVAHKDPDIVKKLEYYLSGEGYAVFVAQGAEEAIRMLDAEKPHIFFLDYDMAESDGMDVLKSIKKIIPEAVIIVTVDRSLELKAIEFMKAGANDYIIQPINKKNISDICEDALKRYHMNLMMKHPDEAELKLHSIIEGIVDGVILLDMHGKITLANRAGKEILKYLDIQRTDDGSLLSLHHVSIKEICNELFLKKQHYVSFEIHSKGDNEKYFHVTASPLHGVAGEKAGVVIVLRDITRGHQLQYQVIKSERLYAVSNLVAGAAHELNNPLAGIQLCTDLVLNEPSISEKAKKYLNRIQKEAEQIQSVVKSLLTLTGNYTLSKEQIDINKIIEEIIEQKANQFTYAKITAVKRLDEKLPAVLVDKHQMRRVFLDIIENACASMGEMNNEKCLTIKTEGYKDMVKIIISDTGPGIPKENLTKIFEPFFTAKNIKKIKGTGLGLSIAHSIVHQHNGRVYAESELDGGAKFVIELPAT